VRKVAPRLADPRPLNPATRALVAAWSLAASTLVGAFVAAHAASALASASAPGGHTLPFLPPALLGLTAAAPLLTLLPVLDDAAAVATARVPPNHPTRLKVAQKLIVGAVAASFSLSLFSLFLSHTLFLSLSLSLSLSLFMWLGWLFAAWASRTLSPGHHHGARLCLPYLLAQGPAFAAASTLWAGFPFSCAALLGATGRGALAASATVSGGVALGDWIVVGVGAAAAVAAATLA